MLNTKLIQLLIYYLCCLTSLWREVQTTKYVGRPRNYVKKLPNYVRRSFDVFSSAGCWHVLNFTKYVGRPHNYAKLVDSTIARVRINKILWGPYKNVKFVSSKLARAKFNKLWWQASHLRETNCSTFARVYIVKYVASSYKNRRNLQQ